MAAIFNPNRGLQIWARFERARDKMAGNASEAELRAPIPTVEVRAKRRGKEEGKGERKGRERGGR